MKDNKVFCMGLWKTGTKSFGEAMRVLGYKVHSAFEPFIDNIHLKTIDELHNLDTWPEGKLLRIWRMSQKYDAMSDTPWHFMYRKLVDWYLDAKFILTLRESNEKLAKSEYYHNLNHGMPKEKMPSKEFFIERYEKHNKYIRDFFRDRDNYTEMVIEKMNWKELCQFLNIEKVPNTDFPWLNKSK